MEGRDKVEEQKVSGGAKLYNEWLDVCYDEVLERWISCLGGSLRDITVNG